MSKIQYSQETLESFSIEELQKICTYYGIEFLPSWRKAKLAKAILAYSPIEPIRKTYDFEVSDLEYNYPTSSNPVIIKSVRIQRIEQSRKE